MSGESEEHNCLNAFENRDKKKCLQMLLQLPTPAKVRGKLNQTLLHLSARNGWYDVTKLLATKYLCEPFSEDNNGYTVLHHACTSGDLDVVMYLVQKWLLDPTKKANDGKTPLDLSEENGHTEIVEYVQSVIGDAEMHGYSSVSEYLHVCAAVTIAMQKGSGEFQQCNIVMHGPPKSGKSSVKQLILGQPTCETEVDTPVIENAVHAVQPSPGERFVVVNEESLLITLANEAKKYIKIPPVSSEEEGMAFLSHSAQQLVPSYSSEPQMYTPKPKVLQDIECHLKFAEPSFPLFGSQWYHLIDTGGLLQLSDVFPLVYRYPSVNIIVIRLNDDLDSKHSMQYEAKCTVQDHLARSNRDFIISMCQTTASQAATGSPVTRVMIIGTHLDHLADAPPKVKEFDRSLLSIRKEFEDVLVCKSAHETIFAVNAIAEGRQREEYTRALQDSISIATRQHASRVSVRLRWLAYLLELQRDTWVLRTADCYRIGEAFGMGEMDVQRALRFFEKSSFILYFPDDIPDLVLTKVEPFIHRLSCLIMTSCQPRLHNSIQEHAKLREKGVFHKNFLELVFREFPKDLHDEEFLKLLECLKIAICIGEGEYFLLSTLSPYPTYKHTFQMSCVPLVFSWGERILPQGFFFTVAVELLGKSNESNFSFSLRDDIAQWREEVQISETNYKIPGVLKLSNKIKWIQASYSGSVRHCPTLYKVVDFAIQKTVKRFEHTNLGSPMITCLCPLSENQNHYCIISEDGKEFTCALDMSKTGPVTPNMLCWWMNENLNIIEETTFLIQGHQGKHFNWEEYGFQLSVPDEFISRKNPKPVLLSVAAVIGGQFEFPPGCQLVSGLYQTSFPERSQKEVTIEIEHCVRMEDLPHNKTLQFISSVMEPSDKCHFRLIENAGNFLQKRQYGILHHVLKEKQAQLFGIVLQDNGYKKDNPILGDKKGTAGNNSSKSSQCSGNGGFHHGEEEDEENSYAVSGNPNNERDSVRYRAFTYYKYNSSSECEFILIAVKDLKPQIVFTKKSIGNQCNVKEGDSFLFQFKANAEVQAISLGVKDQVYEEGNWRISSSLWPCSIKKEAIDELGTKLIVDCYYLDLPNRRVGITALPSDIKKDLIHSVLVNGITEEVKILIDVKISHLQTVQVFPITRQSPYNGKKIEKDVDVTHDELDVDSILVPPELNDVFDLTMSQSVKWEAIGRKLKVPLNFRKTLRGSNSSAEEKLEEVLNKWIESQSAPVTWSYFIKALKGIEMKNVAEEVKEFLKTPEAVEIYGKS